MIKDNSPTKSGGKGIATSDPPPGLSKKFAPENTQSQTLRGDSVQEESARLQELEDSDIEDLERPRPSKKKEKKPARDKSKSRRYTIEPGDFEDEFVLSKDAETTEEDAESSENLFEKIQTAAHFTESVSRHPEEWCNAIRTMATSISAYHDQISDLTNNVHSCKQQIASIAQQLKESTTTSNKQKEEIKRLRHLRDEYRETADYRAEEIFDLKEQMSANLEAFNPGEVYVDSDDETHQRPKPIRQNTAPAAAKTQTVTRNIESHRNTPVTDTSKTSITKSNNKYPDVPDFYGTEGSRFYESWCTRLNSKFRNSWELFQDEQNKVDYIRDHCRDIAYDVIKARSNDIISPDYYLTAEEMIYDLDQMFAEIDREQRAEVEL